nr:hypothetical protein [Tanacetum cinerariifolium]
MGLAGALTIEQYLALIQDNNRPDIVKPKIGDDVEFERNSNFMRELRRKLFVGAVIEVEKRLSAGMINTWDLLKKEFIWQYCLPFKIAKKLEEIRNFKQEMYETLYQAWNRTLKEQIGSPYRTHKTVCMIENPREVHKLKAREDEGDMDVVWDITIKDVERLRQFLTPTIHTLSNREPVVQPFMSLGLVHDKEKIIKEEEQDYDIPLHDGVMQPLTPQAVHITLPDDDYVAPTTNPILNKHLNEFEEEFC